MQTKDFIHIQKVLDGDSAAYSHLVAEYKDMVYTLAFSILKQETEAEDAAQESFIKAYQKLRSFKKDAKFSTWLYTITYRTAVYNLRRRKQMSELPSEEVIGSDTSINQIAQLTQKEQQHYIRNAIKSLPETEGALITLYYLEENTVEEISEITGLSKSNVKVKLFRARKKLKENLSPIIDAI